MRTPPFPSSFPGADKAINRVSAILSWNSVFWRKFMSKATVRPSLSWRPWLWNVFGFPGKVIPIDAGSASANTVVLNYQVCSGKCVTMLTRLLRLFDRIWSGSWKTYVINVQDRHQVRRILASPIGTQMMNLVAVWYRADKLLVRNAVRWGAPSGRYCDPAISRSCFVPRKIPTPVGVNHYLFQQPFFNRSAVSGHKKAADPSSLNWPRKVATSWNRLLNLLSFRYSGAVQSLNQSCAVALKGAS